MSVTGAHLGPGCPFALTRQRSKCWHQQLIEARDAHKAAFECHVPTHVSICASTDQGAVQADVGILVISARKGEFETGFDRGGQTREHALLAKTLGVRYEVNLNLN